MYLIDKMNAYITKSYTHNKLKEIIMKLFRFSNVLLVTILASFSLSSCNKVFYQVYNVKSSSLKMKENALIYENKDLKIAYNLWAEKGTVGFIAMNKTEKDLFIDLKQTFFILNGKANDYYLNREYTNKTITESTISQSFFSTTGYFPSRYYTPTATSAASKLIKGTSQETSLKEKDIICIPANSYKEIKEYNITRNIQQTCDKRKDFPRHKQIIASYTESSSPIKFKNRISYSFDKECTDIKCRY